MISIICDYHPGAPDDATIRHAIGILPVQAATGGRSGVSVYKAGRSVPLDSAQLDLSRLALPQLGSAGVKKCFEIHVPSSGLKTRKNRKTFTNAFHE